MPGCAVLSEVSSPVLLALAPSALVQNRYPTSFPGAVAELEQRLEAPEGLFAEVVAGKRPVLIAVQSNDDVQRALGLSRRHALRGVLLGSPRRLEGQALEIQRAGLGVILGPFQPGVGPQELATAVELGRQGVPLAFALDAPWSHPDALRLCAAQCVRAGLAPERARAALSADAAVLAGVADRLGKLERGLAADFVLWSGDPLDLSSTVEAVYVDGQLVYEGRR
jgi:imidazolonepropionase-like amidohydrolase